MIVDYLNFYLIFVIAVSLVVALVVLRLRLPALRVIIPAIAVLILLPAVLVYLYAAYFTSIPEVVVPDLTGVRLESAFDILAGLQLRSRHSGMVYDMKHPEGAVVSQRPEAGRKVKLGRTVSLLTSSGKRRVTVPNLLGRPLEQADAVLQAKGLLLGKTAEDPAPELDAGIILTQNPLPGDEVEVGTYVSLTISSSEEHIVEIEVFTTAEDVDDISVKAEKEKAKTKDKEQEKGGFFPWW